VRTLEGTNGSARSRSPRPCLNDGQRLLAFNDLFIGAQTHISARYRIGWAKKCEAAVVRAASIVSTGAGSTGWLSSVFNMAAGVARAHRWQGRQGG